MIKKYRFGITYYSNQKKETIMPIPQTATRTLLLSIISTAVLSACGGGGGGGAPAPSVQPSPTPSITTPNPPSAPAPVPPSSTDTNGFNPSSDTQRHNAAARLDFRQNADGSPTDGYSLTTGSGSGLIDTLSFKNDAAVKLDTLKTTDGGTPEILIAKTSNGQTTFGRSSIEDNAAQRRAAIAAARSALNAAQQNGNPQAIAKAQADLDTLADTDGLLHDLLPIMTQSARKLDNGLAYLKQDPQGATDPRLSSAYIVQFSDDTQIVLHDPEAAGWNHQTFAYYTAPKHNTDFGYQSIGRATPSADIPTTGTAAYSGLTTAYAVKNDTGLSRAERSRQMTANVNAVVDFGQKNIRFETSGTQFHSLDSNGRRISTPDDSYNMKGTASWKDGNLFNGTLKTAGMEGSMSGRFYGSAAEEIGGTYGLSKADQSEHLIGGYGAKRR